MQAPGAPAATAERPGCPPTCAGPGIREVAYTSWLDKVIAPIWYISAADSMVMVLDASTAAIPAGYTGTIPSSAYEFVQAASIVGPEGVGLQPPFDRDGDGISDLVEANTEESSWWSGLDYFQPTEHDDDPSMAGGSTTNGFLRGGVQLPQEGIGFYHFHGGTEGPHGDNWGTLKTVKAFEQVVRQWNNLHPDGPRIGIGDMSLENGGEFCWWIYRIAWPPIIKQCHERHQQGLNADISYIRSDGKELGFTFVDMGPFEKYDQSLTQELIYLLCEAGATTIYADSRSGLDTEGYEGCNLSDYAGHQNHIHVRIGKE